MQSSNNLVQYSIIAQPFKVFLRPLLPSFAEFGMVRYGKAPKRAKWGAFAQNDEKKNSVGPFGRQGAAHRTLSAPRTA
jgi:hypothetical protein